jgi:hypothetical protein
MALIILAFGVTQYVVSLFMVGFVSHFVSIILIIVGLFVLGNIVSRIKRHR